jgi:hypothetical protein
MKSESVNIPIIIFSDHEWNCVSDPKFYDVAKLPTFKQPAYINTLKIGWILEFLGLRFFNKY